MGPEQVLVISPSNSITFEGTFKDVLIKKITMRNPLANNVAFKIKTTTPKQYCVRPNIGFIAPEQTKEITIMLQPLQYTLSEKAKHKFMIQSLVIAEEDIANIDLVWKNAPPGGIMCSKLLSVLVQTKEAHTADSKPPADLVDVNSYDLIPSNDGEAHTPEEECIPEPPLKKVCEAGDTAAAAAEPTVTPALCPDDSGDGAGDGDDEVAEENVKLREQVATLKRMVFESTYKWEAMQEHQAEDRGAPMRGVSYDDQGGVHGDGLGLGLPMIVYQLIAFFLGLIIGKFIL